MSLDDDDLKGESKSRYVMAQSAGDGENKQYKIYEEWGKFSRYIASVFDDTTVKSDYVLHLKTNRPKTIPYLAEFWQHQTNSAEHKSLPKPVLSNQIRDVVPCQWCASFMESVSDPDDFYELLLVANYLACDVLADLCVVRLATHMVGKTDKELRNFFNCATDATPEERAEAYAMNADLLDMLAAMALRPKKRGGSDGKESKTD